MDDNSAAGFIGVDALASVPGGHGAFGVAKASGRIDAWEPGGRKLLGFDPAEVVGRHVLDLFAEPVPQALSDCWAKREPWSGQAVLSHRDGRPLRVGLHLRPLIDRAGDVVWLVRVVETEAFVTADATGAAELALLKQWALEQLPLPMSLFDQAGISIAVNTAMGRMLGRSASDLLGSRLGEHARESPFPHAERISEAAERVLRTGETVTFETHGQALGDRQPHAWLMSLYPVKNPAGRILGVSLAAVDATEQYRARRRLDVLNEASERIGTTLDLARTADELAQVATEHFADFIVVDLLDSVLSGEEARSGRHGELLVFRRVAQRSVLPGCPESVVALGALHTYHEQSPTGRALAAGRPLLDRITSMSLEEWGAGVPERAAMIRTFGIHSVLTVPLRARGLTLGVANLCRHRTVEPFEEEDLRLAEDLASRAAVCVDNARRYARERTTALALQRTLLPERAPHQVGSAVDIAFRYLPADPAIGIGGDWFDVIPLSGARVALVVGDVVGHGIQASATMGRLCTAVRTLADVDVAPDELLTQLDDLVLRLDQDAAEQGARASETGVAEVGATCLYAVYDPVSRRCSMARAGHPSPVLITPGGSAEFLEVPAGPPLGLGGLPFEVAEFELPEGSVLAFYTDGLMEAGGDTEADRGVFREALAGSDRCLEAACDQLLHDLLPERRTDDAALLLARTKALGSDRVASWQPGTEPTAVAQARKWLIRTLAAWNMQELEFVAELVVSELVTNAIRYGCRPIQLRLICDTALICEVSDGSSTAPHLRRARIFDEGGRGLLIVAQLTRRWGTRQTPTGKTIWAEIPLVPSNTSA